MSSTIFQPNSKFPELFYYSQQEVPFAVFPRTDLYFALREFCKEKINLNLVSFRDK